MWGDGLLNWHEFCIAVQIGTFHMSEVQSRRCGHEPSTGRATYWITSSCTGGRRGQAFVGQPQAVNWAEETTHPVCSVLVR